MPNTDTQEIFVQPIKLTFTKLMQIFIIILNGFAVDLSSDIISPAIPIIQHEFATSIFFAESIIVCNMLWLGISAVVYGILSDKFGRRMPAIIGSFIFILGTAFVATSHSLLGFIIGRNIQGLGSGFSVAIGIAALRDMFQGKLFVQINSVIGAMLLFVPTLAPIIGSLLTSYYGWHSTFLLILALAVPALVLMYFFFDRTLVVSKENHNGSVLKHFKVLLSNNIFMLCIVINSCSSSGIWLLINYMPYIFQEQFHFILISYGKYISVALLSGVFGAILNSYLINYFSSKQLLSVSLFLTLSSGIIICSSKYFSPHHLLALLGVSIYFFSIANIFSIVADIAFSHVPENITGFASSLIIFTELMVSGILLSLTSIIANGVPISKYTDLTSILILLYASLALGMIWILNKKLNSESCSK